MMAQLIGAAPRYSGSSEACRLKVPRRGIAQTTSGSILKAMTIPRSGCNACKASRNAGSRNFSGCNTGTPSSRAAIFTSLSRRCRPRPAGLSGTVTAPTTLYPSATSRRSDGTANSGVPMKTMRSVFGFIMSCFVYEFDKVAVGVADRTFVVAVARGAGFAQHGMAVGAQPFGEPVDLGAALATEGEVRKPQMLCGASVPAIRRRRR